MTAFLRDTLRQATAREWWLLALMLAVVLTGTNMVILALDPETGSALDAAFLIAAVTRIAGLLLISVAMMRRATDSPRPALLPDGGFWFYVLLTTGTFGVVALIRLVLPGDPVGLWPLVAANVIASVVTAPLAPWITAVAVEKPLAINPAPWLRRIGGWLAPLIVWNILLVTPLGVLHTYIDLELVQRRIEAGAPLEIFDGVLSAVAAILSLALAVTAYRRVAKD